MNFAKLRGGSKWPRIMIAAAIVPLALAAVWMMTPSREAPANTPRPEPVSQVDAPTRSRIDAWIEANHRNRFGDPAGAQYTGGTPLFDPRTGLTKDRYEYILSKHPELRPDAPAPATR